ncbi:MAG TPA: hypothetical protein VGH97_16285 [Thermoanaerobaculia bacterium]
MCTALAQTPTTTPTTTATIALTPSATQTQAATATATATPPAAPTLTLTPNASASPTVTKTVTRTPSITRTRAQTRTATPAGGATPTATPSAEVVAGYIPVVGSLPGNFGSFFKTSVQLLNPGGSTIAGRLIFHPAGVAGSPSDPSVVFSLAPGQVASYPDLVGALGQSGLGSVDVTTGGGQPIPIVTTRIFDDAGASGTSGFTEPFILASTVPAQGSGFLLGPGDVSQFRYNIGLRTIGGPVTVTITVRDSSGHAVHSVTRTLDADFFMQTSAADLLGFSLGNDQSIEIDFSGGGLIAYGATVDNVSNDPSAQFLQYLTSPPLAQGTRTPSAPVLLALVVAMVGVGAGIVIAKR